VKAGWRADGDIIVNSSRAILYASAEASFEMSARYVAEQTRAALEQAKP
jgi:orotidine-5'-phosphate decarboxylase